jgi:hypothetical protein
MEHQLELTIEPKDGENEPSFILVSAKTQAGGVAPFNLREDGRYSVTVRSPSRLGTPSLELQGYRLDDPRPVERNENETVWRWDHDPYFFRNCFGLTVIRVELPGDGIHEFPPVEVVARKLKADEANTMLEYLWVVSPGLIYACFARTGYGGSQGDAPPSVERLLKQLDGLLKPIERLVDSKSSRVHRRRLVETTGVKAPSPGDVIDDRAVHFALLHLDYALEQAASNTVQIPVGYRQLSFDRLELVRKVESTDVYENGIIHGVLIHAERRLTAVQNRLTDVLNAIDARLADAQSRGQSDGTYVEFRTVCGYYVSQVANRPLARVSDMLRRVRRAQARASKVIPATPVRGKPRLTPTFSSRFLYQVIYRETMAWYKVGDGLSTAADLILGLKTLDRLYEYVCLFKLVDALTSEAWELEATEAPVVNEPLRDDVGEIYRFKHPRFGRAELRYEPQIPTATSSTSLWGLTKITGSSHEPFRPDFLLRFEEGAGTEPVTVVLDAKYSTFGTMRNRYIPDLTLKYLHGVINLQRPKKTPFDQLWLLGPVDFSHWTYHNQGRHLGIAPTIGILQVRPGAGHEALSSWLRSLVGQSANGLVGEGIIR